MKKLIIIYLTLVASVSMAQTNKDSLSQIKPGKYEYSIAATTSFAHSGSFVGLATLKPSYTFHISSGAQKPVMVLEMRKDGNQTAAINDWDTMIIKIDKKKFHWLNDSTAVYIK